MILSSLFSRKMEVLLLGPTRKCRNDFRHGQNVQLQEALDTNNNKHTAQRDGETCLVWRDSARNSFCHRYLVMFLVSISTLLNVTYKCLQIALNDSMISE
jgi:hypothetical protein